MKKILLFAVIAISLMACNNEPNATIVNLVHYNYYPGEKTIHAVRLDSAGNPVSIPVRGGTDGAMLSWKGLPCPNLSTGGYNFHGIYEFIPTDSLEMMPEVLMHLAQSFAEGGADRK